MPTECCCAGSACPAEVQDIKSSDCLVIRAVLILHCFVFVSRMFSCSDEEDGGHGRFGVNMDILFEFFRYMSVGSKLASSAC